MADINSFEGVESNVIFDSLGCVIEMEVPGAGFIKLITLPWMGIFVTARFFDNQIRMFYK